MSTDSDSDGDSDALPTYSNRAKKADVTEALLCAIVLFHNLHTKSFVLPLKHDVSAYCDYAPAFIGGVWLNSVRTLIEEDFKIRRVSDKTISKYKTQVSTLELFASVPIRKLCTCSKNLFEML